MEKLRISFGFTGCKKSDSSDKTDKTDKRVDSIRGYKETF